MLGLLTVAVLQATKWGLIFWSSASSTISPMTSTQQNQSSNMKRMDSQKGQALILIALAIDGRRAFSDKRHAQNAADTAVLAATLAEIRKPGSGGSFVLDSQITGSRAEFARSGGLTLNFSPANNFGGVPPTAPSIQLTK